jgi:DNA-binding transcriptional regulator GbsR (MarR family)
MATILQHENLNPSYSYQHIQGEMLLHLNKIASTLKLTHTEYRVMATIIGFFNKETGRAYPSIRQLAKTCRMSHSTIINAIKKLTSLNLIYTIKHQSGRQNYFINQQKFLVFESNTDVTHEITPPVTPCDNAMKTKRKETDKKKKTESFFKNSNKISRLNKIQKESYRGGQPAKEVLKDIPKPEECGKLSKHEMIQNLLKNGDTKGAEELKRLLEFS